MCTGPLNYRGDIIRKVGLPDYVYEEEYVEDLNRELDSLIKGVGEICEDPEIRRKIDEFSRISGYGLSGNVQAGYNML